jgi:tetratricopeptide (TPR) repeat protein
MYAAIYASCLVLALSGPQTPSAIYSTAIDKYVAGDSDAAFEALARVSHDEIQKVLEASVAGVRSNGGSPAARRRLEVIAMLHSEYALFGAVDERAVAFHMDMAHLSLSQQRLILAAPEAFKDALRMGDVSNSSPTSVEYDRDRARARDFLPRWSAFAAGILLTHAHDVKAASVIDEALKLSPDNPELLFWRGVVLEFQAVWVGARSTEYSPSTPHRDGAGFDMVANIRAWVPVEDAYRRALQHAPDAYETHLHLGYALATLRRYADAKTEYELARDRSSDPFVVYVADLLLARLKEDENDVAGAARDYEDALAKMPHAQSAYVGLGVLEARRGNAQRAHDLTERLGAIPVEQRDVDPWSLYHTVRVPMDDVHWLRAAVRQ